MRRTNIKQLILKRRKENLIFLAHKILYTFQLTFKNISNTGHDRVHFPISVQNGHIFTTKFSGIVLGATFPHASDTSKALRVRSGLIPIHSPRNIARRPLPHNISDTWFCFGRAAYKDAFSGGRPGI